MSKSDATHRPDLGMIIAALHDSEINGEIARIYDGVLAMNGFVAEAVVTSPEEAA